MLASTASLVVAVLTVAANAGLPDLIGLNVPPYPAPYSSDQGSCFPDRGEDFCAYSMSTLNAPDGAIAAILAEKGLGHLDDGTAVRRIVDVIPAPPMRERRIFVADGCTFDGETGPIGAIVHFDREVAFGRKPATPFWAVRLDPAREALVVIDHSRVACSVPGT